MAYLGRRGCNDNEPFMGKRYSACRYCFHLIAFANIDSLEISLGRTVPFKKVSLNCLDIVSYITVSFMSTEPAKWHFPLHVIPIHRCGQRVGRGMGSRVRTSSRDRGREQTQGMHLVVTSCEQRRNILVHETESSKFDSEQHRIRWDFPPVFPVRGKLKGFGIRSKAFNVTFQIERVSVISEPRQCKGRYRYYLPIDAFAVTTSYDVTPSPQPGFLDFKLNMSYLASRKMDVEVHNKPELFSP